MENTANINLNNMSKNKPLYWQEMKKLGRPRKCEDPDKLWGIACDYFTWAVNNPMYKREAIKSGDLAGEIVNIEIDRPFTWQGLENHLRINGLMAKLDDYRANKNKNYDEFTDILACIGNIITEQKYSGALVGTYNPNLIARDLGMTEKTETTIRAEQPLFPE